jgi:hypothetical protein
MRTISIAIFNPPTDFMTLDLSQKIVILCQQVKQAYRAVKETNPTAPLFFLCATSTLANPASAPDQTYTYNQLLDAQNELQLFSQALGSDLIILPGAMQITKSAADGSKQSTMKNTLFGSRNITVNTHPNHLLELANANALRSVLEKNGLFERNGIRFGIELNAEHQQSKLKRLIHIYQAEIDIQIILANGSTNLSREKLAKQKNLIVAYSHANSSEITLIRYDANGCTHTLTPIELKSSLAIYPNIPLFENNQALRARL